eukprot:scaffold81417_cov55-Phaeocystis_antarctica.AAC.1
MGTWIHGPNDELIMRQARSVVALHTSATFFAPLGVLRLVLCLALPPLHAFKGGLLAQPAHPLEGGLLDQPPYALPLLDGGW